MEETLELGWTLLSLLPKSHSTTMNTARPKYLDSGSDDYQIKVTISEFWDVSEHYLSLAMKLAKNNLSSIIQLFDSTLDKHEYNHRNKDEDLEFVNKYQDYKSRYSVSRNSTEIVV